MLAKAPADPQTQTGIAADFFIPAQALRMFKLFILELSAPDWYPRYVREPRFVSDIAALLGRAALREKPFSPLDNPHSAEGLVLLCCDRTKPAFVVTD